MEQFKPYAKVVLDRINVLSSWTKKLAVGGNGGGGSLTRRVQTDVPR